MISGVILAQLLFELIAKRIKQHPICEGLFQDMPDAEFSGAALDHGIGGRCNQIIVGTLRPRWRNSATRSRPFNSGM